MHHFIQRRRDEARQADQIGTDLFRCAEDLLCRHHHTQIGYFEVVTLQDHAHDVLANVVDITLNRGHNNLALCGRIVVLLRFDKRHEMSHALFHYPRRFDNLGQEHLAGTEQISYHVHAVHQRTLDDVQGSLSGTSRLLRIVYHVGVDTLD